MSMQMDNLVDFHFSTDEDNEVDLIASNPKTDLLFASARNSMQIIKLADDWTAVKYQIPFIDDTLQLMAIGDDDVIFYVCKSQLTQLHCFDLTTRKSYYSTCFTENIIGLKLTIEYLLVILEASVHIYTLGTIKPSAPHRKWPRKFSVYKRTHLHPAIVSIAASRNGFILVVPTLKCRRSIELIMVAQNEIISTIKGVHSTPVSYIAQNSDGTLVATAGEKGKVIKLFNGQGTMLQVIQRTYRRFRTIYSLTFSPGSRFVLCCSISRYMHIYKVEVLSEPEVKSKKKKRSFFKLPSLKSSFFKFGRKKKLTCPVAAIKKPSDLKRDIKVHGFNLNYAGSYLQIVLSERAERIRIFKFNTTTHRDCILKLDLDINENYWLC